MRNSVAFALLLSLLFIGTAVWARTGSLKPSSPSLIGVGSGSNQDSSTDEFFLSQRNATGTASNYSKTNLVSRGLITDYINLASNGGATEAKLNDLVNKYVDHIPSLTTAVKITYADLQTVDNTKINFQNYSDATTKIELERRKRVSDAYRSSGRVDTLNQEFYSLSQTIGNAYEDAAQKLKKVSVPTSLASAHIKLVNNYFSSASGMKAMSTTDNDPMAAFAGMTKVSSNIEEESVIISEIIAILTKNGL